MQMDHLQRLLLGSLLALSFYCLSCNGGSTFKVPGAPVSSRVVNVEDYGAKGDGSDDTKAFKNAWEEACSSPHPVDLLVPNGKKYLLKPIDFSGSCKSNIKVKIEGTLEASSNITEWRISNAKNWISFIEVKNLVVKGGGTLDGKGQIWWQNSCKINKSLPCTGAPTALMFNSCDKLEVRNLNINNSQQMHTTFRSCSNVQVSHLKITAPEKSPNTDGIHVSDSKNIQITDSRIGTGDDCVSIVSGSQSVTIRNVICGPGHGISIGSLGANNSTAQVSNVIVDTAELHGTTNGVRIKTWQGGNGYAKNIIFQNIMMHNVQNPIIVNQNYCDSKVPCPELQNSAVKISSVTYRNIRGTSASNVAMTFRCSRNYPCQQILIQDVNLVGEHGEATESLCENIKWTKKGNATPPPCNLLNKKL